jgi:hypothetical protein
MFATAKSADLRSSDDGARISAKLGDAHQSFCALARNAISHLSRQTGRSLLPRPCTLPFDLCKHCEWQALRAMPRSGVSRRYAIDAGGRFLPPRYNIFRIPLENDNQSLKGIILLGPRNRRPVLSQDLFFDKICSSPG